ncbi:seminase-like [Calliphora vicina]|uniref:seminase-like n=1 Tax=Calliphora vicina TaxID=7373 RepID=UPI00325AC4B3
MALIWIPFAKLFILILIHNLVSPVSSDKFRIVGGSTTSITNHKYIVSLRLKTGKFFCAGSLVKARYVITAAHCVKGLTTRDLYIHGGVTYLKQTGVKRSVTKIMIPKTFSIKNGTMDVAVLKLNKPLKGSNIATIPLCSRIVLTNNWVTVSGWGFINESSYGPSQQLRTVNVRIISKEKCHRNYRGKFKMSSTMMCASVPGRRDACSGDSGGPLVYRKQLCGIVSLGMGCASKEYPGIYTVIRDKQVWSFINKALRS